MSDISRRINTIEKQLNVGQHKKPSSPPMICLHSETETMVEGRDKLGPVDTWITYQEQLHTQQEANAEYLKNNPYSLPQIIVIELDAGKEYQARGQLKATKNNQMSENEAAK